MFDLVCLAQETCHGTHILAHRCMGWVFLVECISEHVTDEHVHRKATSETVPRGIDDRHAIRIRALVVGRWPDFHQRRSHCARASIVKDVAFRLPDDAAVCIARGRRCRIADEMRSEASQDCRIEQGLALMQRVEHRHSNDSVEAVGRLEERGKVATDAQKLTRRFLR